MAAEGRKNISKTHSLDALLWTTMAVLRTGFTFGALVAVVEISESVISRDFWLLVDIMNDVFDYEMQPMSAEERKMCEGCIDVSPKTVAIVDGVDFSVTVGLKHSKLFYSHKVNVFKHHAIRA